MFMFFLNRNAQRHEHLKENSVIRFQATAIAPILRIILHEPPIERAWWSIFSEFDHMNSCQRFWSPSFDGYTASIRPSLHSCLGISGLITRTISFIFKFSFGRNHLSREPIRGKYSCIHLCQTLRINSCTRRQRLRTYINRLGSRFTTHVPNEEMVWS